MYPTGPVFGSSKELFGQGAKVIQAKVWEYQDLLKLLQKGYITQEKFWRIYRKWHHQDIFYIHKKVIPW